MFMDSYSGFCSGIQNDPRKTRASRFTGVNEKITTNYGAWRSVDTATSCPSV